VSPKTVDGSFQASSKTSVQIGQPVLLPAADTLRHTVVMVVSWPLGTMLNVGLSQLAPSTLSSPELGSRVGSTRSPAPLVSDNQNRP
jgi:hypothetical protein